RWYITGDDDSGPHAVVLAGSGASAAPASAAGGGSGLAGLVPQSALRLLALTMAPRRLRAPGSRAHAPRSVAIGYRLSAPGRIRLTVERAEPGVWRARSCETRVPQRRGERGCTRYVPLAGAIVRRAAAAPGSVAFAGWIGGHRLPAGRYRLVATATGLATGTGSV